VTADDHTNLSRLNKGKPFSPSAQAAAKPMKAGIGEDKADKATVEKAEAEKTTLPLRGRILEA
jgi:hypothetical protein